MPLQVALKIAEFSSPVAAKAKECVNIAYESTLQGRRAGGWAPGGAVWDS